MHHKKSKSSRKNRIKTRKATSQTQISSSVEHQRNNPDNSVSLVKFPESEFEGGYFWNRHREKTMADIEKFAFDRIKAFAFIEKFKQTKELSNVQRVQILKQQYGEIQPKFAKYIMSSKEKSVINQVSFHNKQLESQVVYRPKPIRSTYFNDLQSTDIKLEPPIDLSEFLLCKNKTEIDKIFSEKQSNSILKDSLLNEVIDSTAFFDDIRSFESACKDIETIAYNKRAYVYCILAEYYLQAFYRASSLYNIELMTYYTMLFEKFEKPSLTNVPGIKDKMTKQIRRYNQIKNRLKSGTLGIDMMIGKDYGRSSSAEDLVDQETGLPLQSPLLYYGKGWPFGSGKNNKSNIKNGDLSQLKIQKIAVMSELLLNEPVIHDADPINKNAKLKQLYLFKDFEPIITGNLECLTDKVQDQSMLYLEDLRSKTLIALRELRKNFLLHEFHEAISPGRSQSSALIDKLQSDLDHRSISSEQHRTKIEFTLDEVFDKVFKPVSDSISEKVCENITIASKKLSKLNIGKSIYSDSLQDSIQTDYRNEKDFSSISLFKPNPTPGNLSLNFPSPKLNNNALGHRVQL